MDFPANSHKASDKSVPTEKAEKKINKVVNGNVVTRKKPVGQRLKDIFVGGEFKNAVSYIAIEVLVPAARNMVVDATTKGVERLIYGDSPNRRNVIDMNRSRVSYNNPIDRSRSRGAMLPNQPPHYNRPSRVSNEIILVSRQEAELVLSTMIDIIETYDFASIADLHELVGLPSTHVDNKWGWVSLNHVQIRQIRDGYLIDLPPAKAL